MIHSFCIIPVGHFPTFNFSLEVEQIPSATIVPLEAAMRTMEKRKEHWSFFSNVHLLTKTTRFAKSLSSDIDLDFHSLFSNKGPFFVFQIGL